MNGVGDRLEVIDGPECLRLLTASSVGRLAFVADGRPRIEPVNYAVVDGAVVVRTRHGGKLDAAVDGQTVAFEVDAIEEWARAGWSVVVTGVAAVVPPGDVAGSTDLPQSWAPAEDDRIIRIAADEVTGRRVRTDPGSVSVVEVRGGGAF